MNTKKEFTTEDCTTFMSVYCELKTLKEQYKTLVNTDKYLQNEVKLMWKDMNVVATQKSGFRGPENSPNWEFNNIGYRIASMGHLEYNDPIELLRRWLRSYKLDLNQLTKEEANTKKRWYKFSKNFGKINELTECIRLFELLEHRYIENKKLKQIMEEMRNAQAERTEACSRIDELKVWMREICQRNGGHDESPR